MAHAPLSPSAAYRWMKCSVSVGLSESAKLLGLTDAQRGGAAAEGTVAMAILEQMLLDPQIDFQEAVRRAVERGDIDVAEIQADMPGALETARGIMLSLAEGCDWKAVEHRVEIPLVPTWGTADFVAARRASGRQHLVVADYKHGVGIKVEAERNPQLMLYAAGVLTELGWTRPDIPVSLHIVQPRGYDAALRSWSTTSGQVMAFVEEAAEAARANTYQTGPWCRFCEGAVICGLRIAEVRQVADVSEAEVIEDRSGEALAGVLRLKPRVEEVVSRVEKAAIARLVGGGQVPGFRLREGPGRLAWKVDAVEKLKHAYGEKALSKSEPLSPAQVRDTLPGGPEFVATNAYRIPGRPQLESTE